MKCWIGKHEEKLNIQQTFMGKSDKSKASATTSVFVTHYGNIDDFTELRKVIFNINLYKHSN